MGMSFVLTVIAWGVIARTKAPLVLWRWLMEPVNRYIGILMVSVTARDAHRERRYTDGHKFNVAHLLPCLTRGFFVSILC